MPAAECECAATGTPRREASSTIAAQLLGTVVRLVWIVAGRHHGAAGQHLDPVAAVLDLLAHRFAHGIHAIDDEAVRHHCVFGSEEVEVTAAARDRQVVTGTRDARPREQALLDRSAHVEVGIGHIGVTEYAHRRPTGSQHLLHHGETAQRLVRRRASQVINLVIVGLDQHVGMRVDETGQAGVVRAVDDRAARSHIVRVRFERADRDDAALLDADRDVAFGSRRHTIDERAAA